MSSMFVNQHSTAEHRTTDRGMGRITTLLIVVAALALLGGGFYLAFGNFPPPSAPFEKVLPDARFPK